MWTLALNPSRESGLPPADVTIEATPGATVADLAGALGQHLAGSGPNLLVAPVEDGRPLPAARPLAECGLRSGEVVDVATVPRSWLDQPPRPSRRRGVLRVVAGPDAGRSFVLTTPVVTVGRDRDCTVALTDPLVSRRHATIVLGAEPTITDEGSAHGTLLDGAPITRAVALDWGATVRVGDTALMLEPAPETGADDGRGVLRPPRFGEPLAEGTVDLPQPPTPPRPQPLQWAMFAMPLVFGGALLMQTRSSFGLAYVIGYPIVMLLTWWSQRRRARKEHAQALAIWREDVDAVLAELDAAAAAQRLRAQEDAPEFATLTARVQLKSRALWTRRPGDADFLCTRAGLGPVPALLGAHLRDGSGDRKAAAEVRRELGLRAVLDGLAVPVSFGPSPVVAVTGPVRRVDGVARALLARLAVDHSPAEVTFAAVLGRGRAGHETWLRWLPHTARRPSGLPPVAVGAAAGAALLDALAGEQRDRGVTICLVDEDAGLPRRLVETAAGGEQAQDGRLRLLWLGGDADTVPAATTLLLDLEATVAAPAARRAATRPDRPAPEPVAVLAARDRQGVQLLTTTDEVGLDEVWRLARALVRCTDEAAVIPADTALPDVVRLPALVPDLADPDDVAGIRQRWAARRGLRAQLGVGTGGAKNEIVSLDLREDGPHGLVAGTTGSGKSELLQTLICSLAINNPPERITFLLVDYKGGAAFRECADLPHTVGYITDLSPALVQRALTSLGAEITAREHLLERYAAKDLRALEASHPEVAPPSLLICVDEFAALTNEVPDFVDGVVNIAQRGRSLGMHLLLATQRPAGVVTPHVRANTDLRIALRVASADDSNDVIEAPDAARISRRTPGRAWIRRTGHGTAELVQTGWVGAHAALAGKEKPVRVRAFSASTAESTAPVSALDPRTDLDRLVTAVRAAFDAGGAALPRKPWLPALAGEVLLDATERGVVNLGAGHAVTPRSGEVPIGLLDRPAAQAQGPAVLDFGRAGHVLAFGASGSGKTELLRTVAISAALSDPVPPSIYGIDFAGGGLAMLQALPVVGAVIGESELERVLRLLRMLRAAVADRNRLLARRGAADVAALAADGVALPRVHVLVDNLPALLEALEGGGSVRRAHADVLAGILQDGRRVGVHVTATAPRRTGITSGLQAAFGQRLVLRMPVEDDYAMLGVPAGVLGPDVPAGRALLGRDEMQVATIGGAGTPLQAERLAKLAEPLAEIPRAVGVPAFPTRLPEDVLPEPARDALPLAVEAEFVSAVSVPLLRSSLLIAGRPGSGRTSALAGLAQLARRSTEPPAEIVIVGPRAAESGIEADAVFADPADVATGLAARLDRPLDGWRLVLVDDAHAWEREWERGGPAREAVGALAALAARAATDPHLALVVATDVEDARTRQHVAGAVQLVRRERVGVLLQPDLSDGSVLGTTVPTQTVEPLAGPGRGLLCEGGAARVVQVVCNRASAANPAERSGAEGQP